MAVPESPPTSESEILSQLSARSFSNGVQLRLLTLGASIAYGYTSPDGNGFRFGVRNKLECNGNPVNMIGSVHEGQMGDNDVEGWPGFRIGQVADKAELSIPSKPNVILLHVGTNDMAQGFEVATAHLRLGALIDHLFATIPGVAIIASTLLPNRNPTTEANVQIFNPKIAPLVVARQNAGKKIALAHFSLAPFSTADLGTDGTHPTEAGYQKMADEWFRVLTIAGNKGWFTPPAQVPGVHDGVPNGGCK